MTPVPQSTLLCMASAEEKDDHPVSERVYLLIIGASMLTAFATIFSFIKILTRLL